MRKFTYFLTAAAREYVPNHFLMAERRLKSLLPHRLDSVPEDVLKRVHYYNKMESSVGRLPRLRLGDLSYSATSRNEQLYYIDFMKHAQAFGKDFRVSPLFGDITHVPNMPSLVKSRPISENNANSVVMPLDVLRHFHFPPDALRWEDKRPAAVWRGMLNCQERRARLVALYRESKFHDIADIKHPPRMRNPKGWLTIKDQLKYRYVLSLEGNDVATNLKWIMASNSVALSPKLEYETWFMEGLLRPGVHYIQLRNDLTDLDDKIEWCENNPEKVKQIVLNANSWVHRFQNRHIEALTAALVLKKYSEMTGGAHFTSVPNHLFTDA